MGKCSPDSAITLTFDKPMDQQAVSKALRVERAGSLDTIEHYRGQMHAACGFVPDAPLSRDATYDVILTQDAAATTRGNPSGAFRFPLHGQRVIFR